MSYVFIFQKNAKNCISVYGINMRTISSGESLNSQMNRSFPKHGHLWRFIQQLQSHEFMKSTEMLKLTQRNEKTPYQSQRKRKKDREREAKITFFSEILNKKKISAEEFLEAMADRILLPGMNCTFNIFGR